LVGWNKDIYKYNLYRFRHYNEFLSGFKWWWSQCINNYSGALSYIGSAVNRLTYQENSLTVAMVNTEAARSRIEDADMAYEQLEATKLQILQQISTAMLAQANISPQSILSLMQR